jgi:hypothetical protein
MVQEVKEMRNDECRMQNEDGNAWAFSSILHSAFIILH